MVVIFFLVLLGIEFLSDIPKSFSKYHRNEKTAIL